jgi:hypothetical protein
VAALAHEGGLAFARKPIERSAVLAGVEARL